MLHKRVFIGHALTLTENLPIVQNIKIPKMTFLGVLQKKDNLLIEASINGLMQLSGWKLMLTYDFIHRRIK